MKRFALLGLMLGYASLATGGSVRVTTTTGPNAYALVQGNRWMSSNTSIDEMLRMRKRISGDFLWFRKDGQAYLIREEPLLTQAEACFAPLMTLKPEQADLERRQRALDREEEELEREEEALDRIRDSFDDDDDDEKERWVSESERQDLERRQRDLEARRRPLEEEQRKVEAFERSVEAKEEVLEKRAEVDLWILIGWALANGKAVPLSK